MFAEAVSSLFSSPVRSFRNASIENPRYSLNDPALYELMTAGSTSASGVKVTHEGALAISWVWQAATLISHDISKLPLYPYVRLEDDDRDVASKHNSYFAVAIRANPDKSAKRFWRDMTTHKCLYNNGYAWIRRLPRWPFYELYNLLPDRTAPEWVKMPNPDGSSRAELIYVTEAEGKLVPIVPADVLHIRGISINGIEGADMVQYARDTFGLALAAQGFESKFFKNGARIGGTLELPAAMPKPAADRVEEGFRKSYEEGDNPFRTVILRENAKFHPGQFSPEQAQVSSVDERQGRKVASFYNIPPSKLGIRDSVSYNSFEQESIAYLNGCLHHHADDISDECDMKFLTEKELRDDSHFFEHNYSDFVQADWVTTANGLKTLRDGEIINPNEARRKLNLKRRKDPGGEDYTNPNTRSADAQKQPPTKEKAPPVKPAKNAHVAWLTDTLNRMARRVGADARREAKDSKRFTSWLDDGYHSHCQPFDEAVAAVVKAAELSGDNLRGNFFSEMHCALDKLLDAPYIAEDLARNVDTEMTKFERTAGERIANLFFKEPEDE